MNYKKILSALGIVIFAAVISGGVVWFFMNQTKENDKNTISNLQKQIIELETERDAGTINIKESVVVSMPGPNGPIAIPGESKGVFYKLIALRNNSVQTKEYKFIVKDVTSDYVLISVDQTEMPKIIMGDGVDKNNEFKVYKNGRQAKVDTGSEDSRTDYVFEYQK